MKLPSVYTPADYESNIYDLWQQEGAFEPILDADNSFSMVMPPPNANGNLHLGHALTGAIEDIILRYQRMQGRAALLVPGADHAGFETWVVYEKKLNSEGKSRFDFTREELYKQVWDFVQLNKTNFEGQWRSLGVSCDWSRFTFTLDNRVVRTSYDTFRRLWEDGLVYRGSRIVNFCTKHGTSFSDIEVEHVEEKTKLWHIAYPLAEGSGELVIATTRPETKLGQAALMVNPKDSRYKNFIGKQVLQPLVADTPIPVIGDEYVDMEFGTGVVTVTPAHDPNDFEVAARHNLPMTELITPEGKMSGNVPKPFVGMSVLEARGAVEKALTKAKMLRSVEDYTHTIGTCYKCGTTIEPLLREQWFINMEPLAKRAIKALEQGQIDFYPKSKLKQSIKYLEGLKDWNISRQIAWGIPIPAFQSIDNPKEWIYDTRVGEEEIELEGKRYRRDPDVFDTWFSSGHWPLVTLDYPDGEDYSRHFPLDLMETGFDILPQWVLRMVMLGLYVTDEVPFKAVYLHGLILDEKSQKMSKSKGNVIDPATLITEYGSDALRMGIIAGRSAGNNQASGRDKVVAARNFCNKLWNIARFVEGRVGEFENRQEPKPSSVANHWVLSKLQQNQNKMHLALDKYRLDEAYDCLYHYVWGDLADWYLEASKTELNRALLAYVLEQTLRISHPFAPFVTETIWQTLPWQKEGLLISERWQPIVKFDQKLADEFSDITTIVSESRHIISELQVKKPNLYYTDVPFLATNSELLKDLAGLKNVAEVRAGHGLHLTTTPHTCWLDVDKQTIARYIHKLSLRREEYEAQIKNLKTRLSNKAYTSKAPKQLVTQSKNQLAELEGLLKSVEHQIATFSGYRQN